jgi:hypothetical protein
MVDDDLIGPELDFGDRDPARRCHNLSAPQLVNLVPRWHFNFSLRILRQRRNGGQCDEADAWGEFAQYIFERVVHRWLSFLPRNISPAMRLMSASAIRQ